MLKNKYLMPVLVLASLSGFAKISDPFDSGRSGDLEWELRANLPDCSHQGQRRGAWCLAGDQNNAAKKSGIADKLKEWSEDSKVKSLHLAYFSFSNKTIRYALCDASKARKKINVYLDQSNADELKYWFEDQCENSKNINVYGLGQDFSSVGGHLQHAKVFLASEDVELKSISDMNSEEKAQAQNRSLRFTSSSANMSSNGLSLHFENWLFFTTQEKSYLAQQNICMFKSFEKVTNSVVSNPRKYFGEAFEKCVTDIDAMKRRDIEFYVVPAAKNSPKPINGMRSIVNTAKSQVKVAIHRLTTSSIYKSLLGRASQKGVKVNVIMDDDTLRTGVRNGGDAHDVGEADVAAYRYLRDSTRAEVSFMETNAVTVPSAGGVPHLFHNKFIVVDNKAVFQGAGNFTTRALNIGGDGNYEQFYVLKDKEMVKAYDKLWNELRSRSTLRADHPVGSHSDN